MAQWSIHYFRQSKSYFVLVQQFYKSKEKIFSQIKDCKIKQVNCVKYLGVFLDDKLTLSYAIKMHIEHIETKLSVVSSAIYKLRKYITQRA